MKRYRKPYHDFYTAFWWLERHPAMWHRGPHAKPRFGVYESAFPHNLDVYAAKVNPATMSVDDDKTKNTRTRIWIEVTTYTARGRKDDTPDPYSGFSRHDYPLDCGGDTYEDAVIAIAGKVWKHYGLYGRPKAGVWGKPNRVMEMPKWLPKYARPEHAED